MSFGDKIALSLHSFISGRPISAPVAGVNNRRFLAFRPNLNRSICGRLIYKDSNIPAEGLKIDFYVKRFLKHSIGSVRTDEQGFFNLRYSYTPNRFTRNQRIVMQVVQERLPYAKQGLPLFTKEVILDQFVKRLPLKVEHHNLGDIFTDHDNSSKDFTVIPAPLPSHAQSPAYFWHLVKAAASEILKRLFVTLFNHVLSASQVQKIYNCFGPKYPTPPSTPDGLIDLLLNHVSAVDYHSDGDRVIWEANWDGLDFDRENSLPNVRVEASKDVDGNLHLDLISIKFRDEAEATEVGTLDARLPWALYLARSTFALKGEAESHLAEGHILPGILAQEFFKYINKENPLYAVLQPHLGQIDYINWLGSKGVIFGSGSVLDLSALSADGVAKVIISTVNNKADWLGYQPQEPLTANHYLAKGEKLHFELLHDFFLKYIADNHDLIAQNWEEVHRWSQGITQNLVAMPALTENIENPTEEDIVHLAKFCAWLVSKTTFLHWAAHSRQQLLTDVSQASLAIQNKGLDEKGDFQPFGNTRASDANMQLFLARTLLNFPGDKLFLNPYGDINQELIDWLSQHKAEYGYTDIDNLFLTTQI